MADLSPEVDNPMGVMPAGMRGTVLATRVTLTTNGTAYALPSSALTYRKTITVYNGSGYAIYLGGSGISTSTGMLLGDGSYYSIDLGSAVLYAVCGTAGAIVQVLEVS